MTWVSLKMISLGSLLIFNQHASSSSSSAAAAGRCISEQTLNSRADKFQRNYWDKLGVIKNLPPQRDTRTCAQAVKEMRGYINNRAISPWWYRLNRDVDRIPHEIPFAECLCQGCIINQREELSHNSVSVFASLMVLKRIRCPHDPNRYVVKKDFIKVPVACTCAVPTYVK